MGVVIFLSRFGLAEKREVEDLRSRVSGFGGELESLRDEGDDLTSASPDDFYDPKVDYGARAEQLRREARE